MGRGWVFSMQGFLVIVSFELVSFMCVQGCILVKLYYFVLIPLTFYCLKDKKIKMRKEFKRKKTKKYNMP